MINKNKVFPSLFNVINLVLYLYLGYLFKRENFEILIFIVGLLFATYIYQIKNQYFNSISIWLPRIALLFSVPNLSDDFYRYMLDGDLVSQLKNPFNQLPDANHPLYSRLNSPNYYSIYPPVAQLIFGICSFFAKNQILVFVVMFKTILLIADYFTYKNLRALAPGNWAFYMLNPLIIIEFNANMHLEAFAICFISFYFRYLNRQALYKQSIFLSLAILTKLLPALLLMPTILNSKISDSIKKISVVAVICLSFYIPFLIPFQNNPLQSLSLYFNHFEFNASLYFIFRTIVQLFTGYNPIQFLGPILIVLFLYISLIICLNKKLDFFTKCLFIYTCFFLFSTTVHPWYISTILFLSVFTNYKFSIVWSALVFLSYHLYATNPYSENLFFTFLSYFLLAITFIKCDRKKNFDQTFHYKNR